MRICVSLRFQFSTQYTGPQHAHETAYCCAGIAKPAKVDPVQHERNGHHPRVRGCDACERASVQSIAAGTGGLENTVQRTKNAGP